MNNTPALVGILRKSGGRYMLKEIPLAALAPPALILEALESNHEEGWAVCGVAPAGPSIWVFYRKANG